MNMLPGAFVPLVAVLIGGVVFVLRAIIRPSERMQAVPLLWRALPVAVIVAGLFAGLLSRFYPRTWDLVIVAATLLLSASATWWGWRVDQRLNGPDRTGGATTLFDDNPR